MLFKINYQHFIIHSLLIYVGITLIDSLQKLKIGKKMGKKKRKLR
jgi:hypothetical protein